MFYFKLEADNHKVCDHSRCFRNWHVMKVGKFFVIFCEGRGVGVAGEGLTKSVAGQYSRSSPFFS